jgi:hypothetical protein
MCAQLTEWLRWKIQKYPTSKNFLSSSQGPTNVCGMMKEEINNCLIPCLAHEWILNKCYLLILRTNDEPRPIRGM